MTSSENPLPELPAGEHWVFCLVHVGRVADQRGNDFRTPEDDGIEGFYSIALVHGCDLADVEQKLRDFYNNRGSRLVCVEETSRMETLEEVLERGGDNIVEKIVAQWPQNAASGVIVPDEAKIYFGGEK